MPTSVEDIAEAAATGVLRALDARGAGQKTAPAQTEDLVRSGFFVDIHIRAGGIRIPNAVSEFNPQPDPPGRS